MIGSELKKIPFFNFYFEDLDLNNPKTKKKIEECKEKCNLNENVYYEKIYCEPILVLSNKYFNIGELTQQELDEYLARVKDFIYLGYFAEQKMDNAIKTETEFVCFYVSDLKKEKKLLIKHNYGYFKYLWHFKILKIPIFVILKNDIIAGRF